MSFSKIFGAVFLAIVAAAALILIIAWIAGVRQEHAQQNREIDRILSHR